MPIVTVTAYADGRDPAPVLTEVASSLAAALGCEPGDCWVYWTPATSIAMGTRVVGWDGHCPVAVVRARAGRPAEVVAAGLAAVADALSRGLGVPPEDVWVLWEDVPPSRTWAGGRLLEG